MIIIVFVYYFAKFVFESPLQGVCKFYHDMISCAFKTAVLKRTGQGPSTGGLRPSKVFQQVAYIIWPYFWDGQPSQSIMSFCNKFFIMPFGKHYSAENSELRNEGISTGFHSSTFSSRMNKVATFSPFTND